MDCGQGNGRTLSNNPALHTVRCLHILSVPPRRRRMRCRPPHPRMIAEVPKLAKVRPLHVVIGRPQQPGGLHRVGRGQRDDRSRRCRCRRLRTHTTSSERAVSRRSGEWLIRTAGRALLCRADLCGCDCVQLRPSRAWLVPRLSGGAEVSPRPQDNLSYKWNTSGIQVEYKAAAGAVSAAVGEHRWYAAAGSPRSGGLVG